MEESVANRTEWSQQQREAGRRNGESLLFNNFKNKISGVPIVAQRKWIPLVSMRMRFNPWLCPMAQPSGIAMSCGVGCRCSLDPMLLCLWCMLAAEAQIWPLAIQNFHMLRLWSLKKKKNLTSPISMSQWFSFYAKEGWTGFGIYHWKYSK